MDAITPAEIKTAKRALLVGVGNYDDQASCENLRTPAADVAAMKGVLERPECGFSVTTLVDPTRTRFASAVEEMFTKAGREDTILLYFSGHGKAFDGLHLCTKETRNSAPDSTSVGIDDIKKYIVPTKRLLTILVLDCCYAGQAMATFKGGVSEMVWEQLGRPAGTYLMTSSSMTQPSKEMDDDTNSLFTKWFVKGLADWIAARDKSDFISLKQLFDYVSVKVPEQSPGQTPQYQGFGSADVPVPIARRLGTAVDPAAAAAAPPFLAAVRNAVENNQVIFFLGDGIYRDGPLSSARLIEDLSAASALPDRGQTCLPTAAEQFQRLLDDARQDFLREFEKIIREQEEEAHAPAIHEMLARIEPPWLTVSTTHDLLLERHLESRNLSFVVVTHILRELNPEGDFQTSGKICVMRRGTQPKTEIVTADHLLDLRGDRVIYKLLGSPRFGIWRDPASGFDPTTIDTVVATEDDHVTFVGLLRNEKTEVPTEFSLPFKRKSVVFLGLNLDTWNHRLIATVLRERMRKLESRQRPYAVRKSKSPIEDLFWESLQARVIDVDPEQFVRSLQGEKREA
jgi:hypothetical protein